MSSSGLTRGSFFKEGAHQKAVETAINMLKKENPLKDISEITGLSPEKVLDLQKEILENA